jgi:hypothetical protein
MGILDRLFGRRSRPSYQEGSPGSGSGRPAWGTPPSSPPQSGASYPPQPGAGYPPEPGATTDQAGRDEEAIRRYRYLLRTAPPEAVEQAHAEAFAQLSPDQRRQVLAQLANHVPEYERVRDDDPRTLARMATRAEMRQPGFLERVFGGYGPGSGGYGPGYAGYGRGYGYGGGMLGGGGIGMGGMLAGGLLASIAGSFIGTAIAEELFDHDQYDAFNQSLGDVNAGDPGTGIDFDNQNVDTSGVDDRNLADAGQDYGQGGDGGTYEAYGPDDGGGGSDFGDFGDGGDSW